MYTRIDGIVSRENFQFPNVFPKKSLITQKNMFIGLAVLAAVIALYFFMGRKKKEKFGFRFY